MKLKFILISILGSVSRINTENNWNDRPFNSQDHNNQLPVDESDPTGFKALNDKPQIRRWKMSEVLNHFEPKNNKESTKAEGFNSQSEKDNQFLDMLHSEIPIVESKLPIIYHQISYILGNVEDISNNDHYPNVISISNEL